MLNARVSCETVSCELREVLCCNLGHTGGFVGNSFVWTNLYTIFFGLRKLFENFYSKNAIKRCGSYVEITRGVWGARAPQVSSRLC